LNSQGAKEYRPKRIGRISYSLQNTTRVYSFRLIACSVDIADDHEPLLADPQIEEFRSAPRKSGFPGFPDLP
jgi:hypothetical protein